MTSVQVGHRAKRKIGEFDFFLYPTWEPVHRLEGTRNESNDDKPKRAHETMETVADPSNGSHSSCCKKYQLARLTAVENESTCMKAL